MTTKKAWLAIFTLLPLSVYGAQNGDMDSSWRINVGLGGVTSEWKLGPYDGNDDGISPSVGLAYALSYSTELSLHGSYVEHRAALGTTEMKLTLPQVNFTGRYYPIHNEGFAIHVGLGVGAIFPDGEFANGCAPCGITVPEDVDIEDLFTGVIEFGTRWQTSSRVGLSMGICYAESFSSSDADVGGNSVDFDLTTVSARIALELTL